MGLSLHDQHLVQPDDEFIHILNLQSRIARNLRLQYSWEFHDFIRYSTSPAF